MTNLTPLEVISFDCFGVLTTDGWLAFCQKYANSSTQEELSNLNHQADRGMLSVEQFLKRVAETVGVDVEHARQMISSNHQPNTEVFGYIRRLRSAGFRIAVITNVGESLDHYLPSNLLDVFEVITTSYESNAIKPMPEIYERHLQQLRVEPGVVAFVDDRQSNAEGAEAVGMHGLIYKDLAQTRRDLGALDRRALV